MLKLLLDEHISPQVALGLRRNNPRFPVAALAEWESGNFLGQDDATCLQEAAIQGLTLVTYDRRTIPPLLKAWAETGLEHGGVIFVDEKTVSPADIGGLVKALRELARETGDWDWNNRVVFLRR
jgi:hypothetical protein